MKTVLITGCSSGFGRGMVDEFLRCGWQVISTMRHADQRRELLAEPLEKYGNRLTILTLDVTDPAQREAVVKYVRQKGDLDCLVNNAGDRFFGPLEDLSEAQLRRQMEVNFYGPTLLTRALLPEIRTAQGTIIFVSSTFGYTGFPLTSAYCASKYALEGLAESLYYELKPHGVHVALIEPGASHTNFGHDPGWAEGDSEVYQLQMQNYHLLKERLRAKSPNNTIQVARQAVALAEGRSRRLRVRVGCDATLVYFFQRLVPDGIRLPLSDLFYRRIFFRRPA
ncbi:SDR family oxidoreductase [Trichocoleus sp. FACHB-262]|uniref:SDR family oxidoreductase n=1 Tax=Trichocoleus sp. FACHB-262 TaxID=2692869 RepID=UPI0016823C28|nr:SDR family oxidoreductase [Trichocoleus sp. FACHB-262]MBD2121741.1 SDR family oxidoreductase [Trichocoleus sp. FACHB-262]